MRSRYLASVLLTCVAASELSLTGCGSHGSNAAAGGTATPAAVTVQVSGPAQTRLGSTAQFSAAVSGSSNQGVNWLVNGTAGGSTALGTITSAGLYTAPVTLPGATVSISAVSQVSSAATGNMTETLWNPVPQVASATAIQTGTGAAIALDVLGSSFAAGAQIRVNGSALTTTAVSSTELQATMPAGSSATSLAVDVLNPDPGSVSSAVTTVAVKTLQTSVTAAARLLDQATFGPTMADIAVVQKLGMDGWLTQQFNTSAGTWADIANPAPATCTNNPRACVEAQWWQNALTGQDQLRQRVAFALSEMFVVSMNSVNAYSVGPYQNLLLQDSFGNFSTLMKDVTLSAAMGNYLNMLNSAKPSTGQIANENYARENMQLFTIGLNQLNQDGTPVLDGSGNPIPAYTQAQVQAFARAYTGWTYAASTGGSPGKFPNGTANYDMPMAQVESAHDTSAKVLLNGTTLPAGQTAATDLDDALSNLFHHSNTGPFVCRQLIQHLVSSDPSPAYVARVAAVFADNGSGVRGDLRAVVRAILLDTEARAGDSNATAPGGHLREPMLYLTGVMRGLGYTNTDPNGFYGSLSNYSNLLGERPYGSPSVFNFFPPEYVIPGTTVNAPEFALENTATATLRLSLANTLVYNGVSGFAVDLSANSTLGKLAANPGNLVDSLGVLFMHGQMPAEMRTALVNHVSTLTDPAQRVRVATYLVITSSLYKINH